MTSTENSIKAIRAIIALLIRRTIGRILMLVTVIAFIIALLAGYNASNGMTLLWIIFTLSLLIGLVSGILTLIIYFITQKILPRKLDRFEKQHINSFAKNIQGRLELLRVPLPFFLFNLLIQVASGAVQSQERKRLETTITQSRSLSDDFKTIQKYFDH